MNKSLTTKLNSLDRLITNRQDKVDSKLPFVFIYKRAGVNYYEDNSGVEHEACNLNNTRHGPIIMPLINSTTPKFGHKADEIININEYPPHK